MNKSIRQFLTYNLVSASVTIVQLILVNVLFFVMKDWKAPLPSFLSSIFSEEIVGIGNSNWGYVLPFFLANMTANIYGFFMNRRTTFHSNAPKTTVFVFIVVLLVLIFCSTWIQGRLVFLIRTCIPSLQTLAPTIASMISGFMQFCVIFPLEKFVLFKQHKNAD